MENKKTPKPKAKNLAPKKAPQGDVIFALDIGTRTVIGVLAKKTSQGCKILDVESVTHAKRSMADGQIEDIKSVAEDIKRVKRELENRNKITLSSACIAAAGRALKTLRASWEFKLPDNAPISAETLHNAEMDAVRRTCEDFMSKTESSAFYCVGHSVISLTLDGFKVQNAEGHRGEQLVTDIIGAFLPVYVVDSLCAAVDMARLSVTSLTLEPIAAMNAVVPSELRLINCALCDIGAGTSDVAVSRDGSVTAYGMATTAGDEITEAIMKELLVDFNTAERIKTFSEKDITYTDILLMEHKITRDRADKLIEPYARELAKTIAREIITANATPPQAVFLVGGGSKLKGLSDYVAEELNIIPSHVISGRRELLRGITAPEDMTLSAEHATPVGIALSVGEGVSYDFTTITINGRKLRAPDTNRLTVFELLSFAKITPEDMIAGNGKSLSFTVSGERITLRGEPPRTAEIIVNGKPGSLNTVVTKGDEITVIPAENGADASAHLSDYFDMAEIKSFTITLFGKKQRAGRYILLNGREITAERRIQEGDEISLVEAETVEKLLTTHGINESVLLNYKPAAMESLLKSGDIISRAETSDEPAPTNAPTTAPEEQKPSNPHITVNGIEAEFPIRADGNPPIFLDIATAFSDNPTALLASAKTITINGKIARLDEEIHNGDVIIIE
ncbi:MAG: pilus assembly protein PilM [Oscillospiraceae bacterium]|nr:pilus assembly protein PilM [Oscillospiraceae bacterium]